MGRFAGLNFYAPPGADRATRVPLPDQLDYDTTELAHLFHRDFLAKPDGFSGNILLPFHVPISFLWSPLTQTSGYVLWKTNDEVRAASCLLVGVETPDDKDIFSITLAVRGVKITAPIFSTMVNGERPLITTIHFDIRSVGDPVLATVAPVFAAAFIAMFE